MKKVNDELLKVRATLEKETKTEPTVKASEKPKEMEEKKIVPAPALPSTQAAKSSQEQQQEPHFQSRSTRKKSPSPSDKSPEAALSRNNSSGLPKQLGTIEEDESEQRATISPSQVTKTTQQNDQDDGEDGEAASAKASATAAARNAIPSLNLDQDNLRKKTTENMK